LKILLVCNRYKQSTRLVAEKLTEELKSRGARVEIDDGGHIPAARQCELIIILGGDGTILRAARGYGSLGVPMLGVNMGTVGFLTKLEIEELHQRNIERLLAGDYIIDERMMFNARVFTGAELALSITGLNDAVVRAVMPRMLSVRLEISGQDLGIYRGDGLLVATPTGSTAYSLSAGGPVCDPEIEAFVVTPLASIHSSKRPMVISGGHQITIYPIESEETVICVDGQVRHDFKPGYRLEIASSGQKLRLVDLKMVPFFAGLNERLGRIENS